MSQRALRYALLLGRQHRADVRVVQVIDPGGAMAVPADAIFELTPELRQARLEDLGWFMAPLADPEFPVDIRLREGQVVSGILAEADDMGADLIVMGTHGRSGFERLALGSVTEKVLRKATCPVLAVPGEHVGPVPLAIRRVLCPTDFSPASDQAVTYGRFMALTSGAALWISTVIDWPFGDTHGSDAVSQLRQSIEAEAQSNLDAAAAPGGPPTETYVLSGTPWKAITTFARENKVGLIVIGVSGRGAVDRALLGSTTHHVVRDAPCPVLTVHAPQGR